MRVCVLAVLAMLALPGCVTGAAASSDDRRWIAQCQRDNRDAAVSARVVRAYCACMNDHMSNNERRSISQWEGSHPRESRACERQSGWR